MPAPPPPLGQGTNVDFGCKHQFMSNPQASGSNPVDASETLAMSMIPNTDPTFNNWLNDTEPDTQEAWSLEEKTLYPSW